MAASLYLTTRSAPARRQYLRRLRASQALTALVGGVE